MCLCGYGLDASVCVAQLGVGGEDVECACSLGGEFCAVHDDAPADGETRSSAAHDPVCPLCHTLSVDGPSIDFVVCVASDIAAPLLTLAPSFDVVLCAPSVARVVRARERAPPDGTDVSPGLWPGVRPLRI